MLERGELVGSLHGMWIRLHLGLNWGGKKGTDKEGLWRYNGYDRDESGNGHGIELLEDDILCSQWYLTFLHLAFLSSLDVLHAKSTEFKKSGPQS